MRDKLLNKIRDTPACQLAYQKPAPNLRGVISDLQASVATAIDVEQNSGPTANYLSRRRHDQYQNDEINGESRFGGGSCREKRCMVCGKPKCWTTNHPICDRMNAFKSNKHIKAFLAQFNDDVHQDSDPERQDVLEDHVTNLVGLSHATDDAVVETGSPHEDIQENLQIFFHNFSDCAVMHTITQHIPSALTQSA